MSVATAALNFGQWLGALSWYSPSYPSWGAEEARFFFVGNQLAIDLDWLGGLVA